MHGSMCWACLSLIAYPDWNRMRISPNLNVDFLVVQMIIISMHAKLNESKAYLFGFEFEKKKSQIFKVECNFKCNTYESEC